MTLPRWAPLLKAARDDARRARQDPAPAVRAAAERWLRDAVERTLAAVASAGCGGRNGALFRAADDLGSLVAAGALSEDDARARLVRAGTEAGLDGREAQAAARRGLQRGMKRAARLPELDAPLRQPGKRAPRPAPLPDPAPVRLPADDVARLWAAGWPVFTEARSRRWFAARELDSTRAAVLDLARALPPGADCPPWARCAAWTWATAWPLLLPCFDAAGELVALRARWTTTTWDAAAARWVERRPDPGEGSKELSPHGAGACIGTVYACPVGRWLLRRGPAARPGDPVELPARAGDCARAEPVWSGAVLVVEGGPCWLRYAAGAQSAGDDGRRLADAVLGLWAGAWPDADAGRALAARVPRGARVVLAPDDDGPGHRYADAVIATLRGRAVELLRLPPEAAGGNDDGTRT